MAEALLTVTDGRAQASKHGSVKGAYGKLRGSARKNVERAVPGLVMEDLSPARMPSAKQRSLSQTKISR